MQKVKKDLFFLFSTLIIYFKITALLGDFDEIWVFNSARNLAAGNIVYKDFNLVVLPFFHFFVSIFLRIFGQELLVYRVVQIFILIFCLYISWKILDKLEMENYFIFHFLIGIYFVKCSVGIIEYNYFALMITLLIIYIDLFYKENKWSKYVIGLLCAFCILIKQTVGVLVTLVTGIKYIILIRKKVESVSSIKKMIIAGIFPLAIFFIYLLVNNCFFQALDYTCFSSSDFMKNGIANLDTYSISSLVIILIGFLIFICVKNKDEKIYTMFGYGIALLIISFPILDFYHLKISLFIFLLMTMYGLKKLGVKSVEKKLEKFYSYIVFFSVIVFSMMSFYIISYEIYGFSGENLAHFKGITSNLNWYYMDVARYAKENDILILESYSTLYSILNDEYNGFYDVLLNGNLGSKGYKKVIEDLENKQDLKVMLISDVENNNWQFPRELYYYVTENYEKIDEFYGYSVYQIK